MSEVDEESVSEQTRALVANVESAASAEKRVAAFASLQAHLETNQEHGGGVGGGGGGAGKRSIDHHEADAIASTFKLMLKNANQSVSAAALLYLPSYAPLLVASSPTSHQLIHNVRVLMHATLALVLERLGDQKDRIKEGAKAAIAALGSAAFTTGAAAGAAPSLSSRIDSDSSPQAYFERMIRDQGLGAKSAKVKEQAILALVPLREAHNKLPLRPFLASLVELVSHADPSVRDAARMTLISLFSTASPAAKADLKKEMEKKGVRKQTADAILQHVLAAAPGHADVIDSVEPNSASAAVRPAARPASRLGGRPAPTATTHAAPTAIAAAAGAGANDDVPAVYIASQWDMDRTFSGMLPCFEGKETEHNWLAREQSIVKVRGMLKTSTQDQFGAGLVAGVKSIQEGILKTLASLRTTLAIHTTSLINELALALGDDLDSLYDAFLPALLRMAGFTKRIVATATQQSASAIFSSVSFRHKFFDLLWQGMNEKMVACRQAMCEHLTTILEVHGRHRKHALEVHGGVDMLEKMVKKTLPDQNKDVRAKAREAYFKVAEIWPALGSKVLDSLDAATRKQVLTAAAAMTNGSGSASQTSSATAAPSHMRGPSSMASSSATEQRASPIRARTAAPMPFASVSASETASEARPALGGPRKSGPSRAILEAKRAMQLAKEQREREEAEAEAEAREQSEREAEEAKKAQEEVGVKEDENSVQGEAQDETRRGIEVGAEGGQAEEEESEHAEAATEEANEDNEVAENHGSVEAESTPSKPLTASASHLRSLSNGLSPTPSSIPLPTSPKPGYGYGSSPSSSTMSTPRVRAGSQHSSSSGGGGSGGAAAQVTPSKDGSTSRSRTSSSSTSHSSSGRSATRSTHSSAASASRFASFGQRISHESMGTSRGFSASTPGSSTRAPLGSTTSAVDETIQLGDTSDVSMDLLSSSTPQDDEDLMGGDFSTMTISAGPTTTARRNDEHSYPAPQSPTPSTPSARKAAFSPSSSSTTTPTANSHATPAATSSAKRRSGLPRPVSMLYPQQPSRSSPSERMRHSYSQSADLADQQGSSSPILASSSSSTSIVYTAPAPPAPAPAPAPAAAPAAVSVPPSTPFGARAIRPEAQNGQARWFINRAARLRDEGQDATALTSPVKSQPDSNEWIRQLSAGEASLTTFKKLAALSKEFALPSSSSVEERGGGATLQAGPYGAESAGNGSALGLSRMRAENERMNAYDGEDGMEGIDEDREAAIDAWQESRLFERLFAALTTFLETPSTSSSTSSGGRSSRDVYTAGLVLLHRLVENQFPLFSATSSEADLVSLLFRLRRDTKRCPQGACEAIMDSWADKSDAILGIGTLVSSLRAALSAIARLPDHQQEISRRSASSMSPQESRVAIHSLGLRALSRILLRLPTELIEEELPRARDLIKGGLNDAQVVLRQEAVKVMVAANRKVGDPALLFGILQPLERAQEDLLMYYMAKK